MNPCDPGPGQGYLGLGRGRPKAKKPKPRTIEERPRTVVVVRTKHAAAKFIRRAIRDVVLALDNLDPLDAGASPYTAEACLDRAIGDLQYARRCFGRRTVRSR